MVAANWKCVRECASTEYVNITGSTPTHVCKSCSARFAIGVGNDIYYDNCEECSSHSVCTKCTIASNGYIRVNLDGCILNCKDDIPISYKHSSIKKCVSSCRNGDAGKAISEDSSECLAACTSVAYFDTSGADNRCILCTVTMADCVACTSATVCTACQLPKYLKASQTGCVASCAAENTFK